MFFVAAFSVLLSSNALATEQWAESLMYKGEELELYDTPLEMYFSSSHPRPDFGKLISGGCSGEWRGYHGVWEVKDGFLYLEKLQKPCPRKSAPDAFTAVIFPGEKTPVKAVWVNGAIHALFKKKMLELRFDKGKLIKEEIKDWPPSEYNYQLEIARNQEYWMHEQNMRKSKASGE